MDIIIESLLIAAVAVALTVGIGKLSLASAFVEPSWKTLGWISVLVTIVFEIVYWVFIK
jgi:hypothetical protein